METVTNFFDLSNAQFVLFKAISFIYGAVLIKLAFVVYASIFTFLAFVRASDEENNLRKRVYFGQLSVMGIIALIVFFIMKYNNLILLGVFGITVHYWLTENVRITPVLKSEWQQDWLPRIRGLKTIAAHFITYLLSR